MFFSILFEGNNELSRYTECGLMVSLVLRVSLDQDYLYDYNGLPKFDTLTVSLTPIRNHIGSMATQCAPSLF